MRQRKLYISLALLIYLVGIVYAGFNFHIHFNPEVKQISEHNCADHKYHSDLNDEFACFISHSNSFYVLVNENKLTLFTSISQPFILEDLVLLKSLQFISISKRAPPAF
ncbi:MAG: hypothetical protein ABDI07_10685 [Candidatus Kryptonium sp.]